MILDALKGTGMKKYWGGWWGSNPRQQESQSWARATKRAGMDDLHFHDLRHEATSRLAEKLALHELMKVTGHKDTRMLARYYHPRAEDLARKMG